MRKIISIAAIGIVLVVGFVYFRPLNSKSTVDKTEPGQETSTEQGTPKLIDQIREYPGIKEAKISQAEAESECKEALEAIETLPLNTLVYDLTNQNLKLNPACLFISQKVSPMLMGFPEVCEAKPNGTLTNECIQKLFYFKNYRIHRATKDENLDSLSTEIIISKLMALLTDADLNSPEGQKQLRQVGAKIYERMPESESAAKASIVGYFSSSDNLSDIDKAEYEKNLNEVRSKFPQNWEIYEMNLVHQKINSKENFRKEILNYYRNYPNSGIANYHMGCLEWSDNNKNAAQALFQKAVQLNPREKRFVATLEKSKTVQPPEYICEVQVGFSPDQF